MAARAALPVDSHLSGLPAALYEFVVRIDPRHEHVDQTVESPLRGVHIGEVVVNGRERLRSVSRLLSPGDKPLPVP
jgi:hypothetical protein